jgi:tetratricopeptide (TPR) repeat protein
MSSRTRRAVSGLALVLMMSLGTASAFRQGRLIGKVADAKGKPIAGVRVTTTSPALPDFKDVTATDAKGVFKVDFEKIDIVYVYELEKVGYVPLRVEQKWTVQDTDRHEFQMVETGAPSLGELGAHAAAGTAADAAADPASAPAEASSPAVGAFNEGVRAFKAKDYATAAARLQEAATQDPSLRQAWVALSATYMQQRDYPHAAEAAEKAIALGATEASVLETRWDAYRQMGDRAKAAKAREELERIARLSDQAKAVYNDGVARQKLGEEEGALAKFQGALELDPNFEPALLALAASALKLGRAAEAHAAAETALKLDPGNAEALKVRYNAALKLKDEAKLAEALAGLAAVDAATARDGLFLLAQSAFANDDAKAAKERLRRVLAINPAHARSHYILGLIFMREGAKAQARTHFQRFIDLAPSDPDVASARDALRLMQ